MVKIEILEKQQTERTEGILFNDSCREKVIERNGIRFTCRHDNTLGWTFQSKDATPWFETGAFILRLSSGEYLVTSGKSSVFNYMPIKSKK